MGDFNRLVRKEVSLGAIRERQVPQNHIGLAQIAPWLDVATDDVIFDYIKGGLQEGLAPARAEDAEAELAQKDDLSYGEGRAAIVDWSLKDRYSASDVSRFRENLLIQERLGGTINGQPGDLRFTGSTVEDFNRRVARHDALRKRKLDNRIEWLIMTGFHAGTISYNDGKIKFTVDYGRPADQNSITPPGGLWNTSTCDPIGDVLAAQQMVYDRTGVTMDRGLISKKAVMNLWKSDRFLAALGLPIVGGTLNAPLDPKYLGLAGYSPEGALAVLERATGVTFTIYDTVYQTRPIGSATFSNTRFVPENKVVLWPSEGQLGEIDDTEIGFAKTLNAPHPEGNWTNGFYEWEDETKDPWQHVRGSGVKAFPVFPYLQMTFTYVVLP